MMHELQKLVAAVENLSRIKGGRTLFEHSPTNDEECANAWLALNAAMCEAKAVLSAPNAPELSRATLAQDKTNAA